MILDVGCGWDFKGDVNVDLFLGPSVPNRQNEQEIYMDHKTEAKHGKIPNLLCADANHLPFKAGCFSLVLCRHLFEHKGIDHMETARELLRVTRGKVVISVPSPLCKSSIRKYFTLHDKIFTKEAFNLMFRQFKRKVHYTRYDWGQVNLPSRYLRYACRVLFKGLPCPIPTEIICEVWKDAKT